MYTFCQIHPSRTFEATGAAQLAYHWLFAIKEIALLAMFIALYPSLDSWNNLDKKVSTSFTFLFRVTKLSPFLDMSLALSMSTVSPGGEDNVNNVIWKSLCLAQLSDSHMATSLMDLRALNNELSLWSSRANRELFGLFKWLCLLIMLINRDTKQNRKNQPILNGFFETDLRHSLKWT